MSHKEKKVICQDNTKKDPIANLSPEEKTALLKRLAAEEGMTLKKANQAKDEFESGVQAASLRTEDFCGAVCSLIAGPFSVTVGRDVDGWLFGDVKRLRRREKGNGKDESPPATEPPAPEAPAPQATA
jgi:hypothetical protein